MDFEVSKAQAIPSQLVFGPSYCSSAMPACLPATMLLSTMATDSPSETVNLNK
jgi:hypothetical protein